MRPLITFEVCIVWFKAVSSVVALMGASVFASAFALLFELAELEWLGWSKVVLVDVGVPRAD